MASHTSILAWRSPETEESGRVQLWGQKESNTSEPLTACSLGTPPPPPGILHHQGLGTKKEDALLSLAPFEK